MIAFHTVQMLREKQGLRSQKRTMHLAFMGNPGTGKTTVARIVGRIYKQIGLLSKGHFMEVSRTDLIAGYQGQTALKVKKSLTKPKAVFCLLMKPIVLPKMTTAIRMAGNVLPN